MSQRGFVLPVVLLALVALTGVMHVTLLLATAQRTVSRAEVAVLQARLAARSAVLRVAEQITRGTASVEDPVATGLDPLPWRPPTVEGSGGGSWRGWARGVSMHPERNPEWIVMEGLGTVMPVPEDPEGRGPGPRARARELAVFWRLDPRTRLRSLAATVEHGGPVLVDDSRAILPLAATGVGTEEHPEGCAAPGDGAWAAETRPATALVSPEDLLGRAAPVPAAPGADAGLDAIPRLGILGGRDLVRVSSSRRGSASSVDPAATLRVTTGPWSVPSEGFVGLAAVGGDLVIDAERRLTGLVLVGGDLWVRDGGRLIGAARVAGTVHVQGSGRIEGSPCPVLSVLEAISHLSSLHPAPQGTWVRLP